MFQSFKAFLADITRPHDTTTPEEREAHVQLAAAVLLVEVVRADGRMDADERAAATSALQSRFHLATPALDELLVHAPQEHADEVAALIGRGLDDAARRWSGTDQVRFVADTSIIRRWSEAKV